MSSLSLLQFLLIFMIILIVGIGCFLIGFRVGKGYAEHKALLKRFNIDEKELIEHATTVKQPFTKPRRPVK